MMEDSPGRVLVMAGKDSEGRFARGSKWGMKRIEGRVGCEFEVSLSLVASPLFAILGPAWGRVLSTGAAVSARFLVIGLGIEGAD
jgi:hypothetical protein